MKPLILITNDDGIHSAGLLAVAEALADIGDLVIAAPEAQQTAMGRGMPNSSTGVIRTVTLQGKDRKFMAYSVHASPSQAVQHAMSVLMDRLPDLVVSGINYGENIGSGVTISGTVGAALEAACHDVMAIAASYEVPFHHHESNTSEIDFSVAAAFTRLFVELALAHEFPDDIDLLKIEVPSNATLETPWEMTRLSTRRHYGYFIPPREDLSTPAKVQYFAVENDAEHPEDSDVAVFRNRKVAVTPMSLDMTSRVDLAAFEKSLRRE